MGNKQIAELVSRIKRMVAELEAVINEKKGFYNIADIGRLAGIPAHEVGERVPPPTHLIGRRHYYNEREKDEIMNILKQPRKRTSFVPDGYHTISGAARFCGVSETAFKWRRDHGAIPSPSYEYKTYRLYTQEEVESMKAFFDSTKARKGYKAKAE